MSRRLAGRFGYPEAPNHFNVTWHPDKLDRPLHWKKPRRIFVCSMSDLFHENVPNKWRDRIFAVIGMTQRHTYQLLTKRPRNTLAYFTAPGRFRRVYDVGYEMTISGFFGNSAKQRVERIRIEDTKDELWSKIFGNVQVGVTVCNQDELWKFDELRKIPTTVRFVSFEPLLGPIDTGWISTSGYRMLSRWYGPNGFDETGSQPERDPARPDWIIVGAETGAGARPMDLDWARSIRDQCQAAGVAFFMKQVSGSEIPSDLMIKEFPDEL